MSITIAENYRTFQVIRNNDVLDITTLIVYTDNEDSNIGIQATLNGLTFRNTEHGWESIEDMTSDIVAEIVSKVLETLNEKFPTRVRLEGDRFVVVSDQIEKRGEWSTYRSKGVFKARPYVLGEDLGRVYTLRGAFAQKPKEGDMIADLPEGLFLIRSEEFEENYEKI